MVKRSWLVWFLQLYFFCGCLITYACTTDAQPHGTVDATDQRTKREIRQNLPNSSPFSTYAVPEKKMPRGFLGMRGKKMTSIFNEDENRQQELGPWIEQIYKEYKLIPGEGQNVAEMLHDSTQYWTPLSNNLAREHVFPIEFNERRSKKVPSGFVDMRGKKIPSTFLGMRGKKEVSYSGEMDSILQSWGKEEKRTPRRFLGMRGKKATYNIPEDSNGIDRYHRQNKMMYYKRKPFSFLGMRG